MHARIWTTLGIVATISVISVPAQQPATPPGTRVPAPHVLPGTKSSAFTTIQGSVVTAQSTALPFSPIRLRDARVGRVVKTLKTDEHGLFVFRTIDPGSYVVELMADERTVLAASTLINVNAGEVGSTVLRQPMALEPLASIVGHADPHAATVAAAAATNGILASRVPGDDVSPR